MLKGINAKSIIPLTTKRSCVMRPTGRLRFTGINPLAVARGPAARVSFAVSLFNPWQQEIVRVTSFCGKLTHEMYSARRGWVSLPRGYWQHFDLEVA